MVLMYAVKLTGTLRISEEGERQGLDLHEHGAPAYPEFVVNRGGSVIYGDFGAAPATAPARPDRLAPAAGATGGGGS